MVIFFIGLALGTSFGFLIGAIMTHAKFADERMEREEWAGDRSMKQVESKTLVEPTRRKELAGSYAARPQS